MRAVPDLQCRGARPAGVGPVSPLRPVPPRRPRHDCDTWLLVLALGLIVDASLYAVVTA